jgi:hypothetical protein
MQRRRRPAGDPRHAAEDVVHKDSDRVGHALEHANEERDGAWEVSNHVQRGCSASGRTYPP